MGAAQLTPIERGALFALMAAGRPLKENAELKGVHGIILKVSHRNKLRQLGLIETTTQKPLTHTLSKEGWQWARTEITATKPKGTMGLGPLYSVLSGLHRYIERNHYTLEDIFCTNLVRPEAAAGYLREAAWSEADEALGQALQDIPVLTRAFDKLDGASPNDASSLLKRARMAAELVLQSVRQASRKRELSLVVEANGEAAFDPTIHRSDATLEAGERVRVRKAPVVRGSAASRAVVLMGEVEPL
jgi:hypothetical protein